MTEDDEDDVIFAESDADAEWYLDELARSLAGSLPDGVHVQRRSDGVGVGAGDDEGITLFRLASGGSVAAWLWTVLDQLQADISEWTTDQWPAPWEQDGRTVVQPYVRVGPHRIELGFTGVGADGVSLRLSPIRRP
ncbi:hypothetical protein DSM112329_02904 [Paraconexibacter sp. AEG42_29]|uniref:Uncharacterized protein n=1 Tax=Paraconexibacter sp. AEG42_29 TaxID=2997339 RepID=A0AAU7AWN3_9ACTN